MNNIKCALFDLDGTLLETAPDLSKAVNVVLYHYFQQQHNAAKVCALAVPSMFAEFEAAKIDALIPHAVLRGFIGNGLKALLERAFTYKNLPGDDIDALLPKAMDVYEHCNGAQASIYAGIHQSLIYLQQKNRRIGCVTNKATRFTVPLLERTGLADFMEMVVCGDTLQKRKPDPDQIWYACEQLGCAPINTVMFGDSVFDIQAAKKAGAVAVALNYGYSHAPVETLGADFVIGSAFDFVQQHIR